MSENNETKSIQQRLTEVVRAADKAFESSGGSSRHYVNECLVPELLSAGLVVVDTKDLDASLRERDEARALVQQIRKTLAFRTQGECSAKAFEAEVAALLDSFAVDDVDGGGTVGFAVAANTQRVLGSALVKEKERADEAERLLAEARAEVARLTMAARQWVGCVAVSYARHDIYQAAEARADAATADAARLREALEAIDDGGGYVSDHRERIIRPALAAAPSTPGPARLEGGHDCGVTAGCTAQHGHRGACNVAETAPSTPAPNDALKAAEAARDEALAALRLANKALSRAGNAAVNNGIARACDEAMIAARAVLTKHGGGKS